MNKRIVGIDLGEARIGIAVSDELGMLAHPKETIKVRKGVDPIKRVLEIVAEAEAEVVVVGLPKNMDGSLGPAAEKSKVFAQKIMDQSSCQVRLWDERLTTVAAQRDLRAVGKTTRQSRSVIDQVAAQHILQGYLDSLEFTL